MPRLLKAKKRTQLRHSAAPSLLLGLALGSVLAACGTNSGRPPSDGGDAGVSGAGAGGSAATGGSGSASDPAPVFTQEELALLAELSPITLPPPPVDATNRYANDEAAANFGAKLFKETEFSGPLLDADNDGGPSALGNRGEVGKVACAGCHIAEHGFSDTRSFQLQISLGSGWGRRRAPSLLNVAHSKLLTWDGRRDTFYNQVFAPIESVVEMNSSRLFTAQKIFEKYRAEYEAIFGPLPPLDDAQRFPHLSAEMTGCQPLRSSDPQPHCDGTFHGSPGDQAEFDGMAKDDQDAVTRVVVNMGKALGAFQRRLTCGAGTFDAWMRGDQNAISRSAQRGAQLFVGKGRCVKCHSGPFMSDDAFHNVGLRPETVQQAFIDSDDRGAAVGLADALLDPLNSKGVYSDGDDGRLSQTVPPEAEGAFRTPTLRCVAGRPNFMHTGQLSSLEEVVSFFDQAGNQTGYPGQNELHALGLAASERQDLVAFMKSLDGPITTGE